MRGMGHGLLWLSGGRTAFVARSDAAAPASTAQACCRSPSKHLVEPRPNMDVMDDLAAVDNPAADGNVVAQEPDLEQSLIDRQVDAAMASQLENGGQINASIKAALAHLTEAPT